MAHITPTVTAENLHVYRTQIELLEEFADRIHVDLMDGEFAPSKSPDLNKIWIPDSLIVDMHVMYKRPHEYIDRLVELKPSLVVIPAECDSDISKLIKLFKAADIKTGLAVLQETPISSIKEYISELDHVLIFSGNLGYQGGSKVDFSLLSKVDEVKELNNSIEIGWDGGVNLENARQLIDGGIDILNVGGYIHMSEDPVGAYRKLKDSLVQ